MTKASTTVRPQITYAALVGRVIEHAREGANLHQQQVAEALGITQSAYSRLEKGQSAMSVAQLHQIGLRVGVPPGVITGRADQLAAKLQSQGALIANEKQEPGAAGLLVALGLLAAILAARG
jgi:transcriptional regulator with XRE-family HTH domain